jgi:hypothetical protein
MIMIYYLFLQPLWVLAYSALVEYSQLEVFTERRSNSRNRRALLAEGGTMGEK